MTKTTGKSKNSKGAKARGKSGTSKESKSLAMSTVTPPTKTTSSYPVSTETALSSGNTPQVNPKPLYQPPSAWTQPSTLDEGDIYGRFIEQAERPKLYDRVPVYSVRAMQAADAFDDAFNKSSKRETSTKEQTSQGKQGRGRNQNLASNKPGGRRG